MGAHHPARKPPGEQLHRITPGGGGPQAVFLACPPGKERGQAWHPWEWPWDTAARCLKGSFARVQDITQPSCQPDEFNFSLCTLIAQPPSQPQAFSF
eukprot:1159482-Pelagomonas_calceolata.AAC.8